MSVQLIHKNSNVEDKHPTPNQLANGEIALNYNESGAFLTCKDSNGNLQQVGGVKIDDATPGSPSKQALWFQPSTSKLFIYDGTGWLVVASGGGSGSGSDTVDQILAGNGVNADPPTGLGVITLDADLNFSRGLEFVAGQIAIALGAGLEFDVNGKLASTNGPVQYRGTLDLTSSDPKPTNPSQGDTWVNTADGTSNAVWNPDISTGTTVEIGDIVIYNGTVWTFLARGLSPAERTDLGLGVVDNVSVEVTSSTGSNVQLPAATGTTAGVLTAADKVLIDEGASTWERNGSTVKPVDNNYDVEIGGGTIDLNSNGSAVFGSTALSVDAPNSKVGIGITSPQEMLHVEGGNVYVRSNVGNSLFLETSVANGNDSTLKFRKSRGTSGDINDNDALGTIEWYGHLDGSLKLASKIITQGVVNGTSLEGLTSYYSDTHKFVTSNSERVRIDETGDVSIGGTLPSAPNISLNSDGSINVADGAFTVTSIGQTVIDMPNPDNLTLKRTGANANIGLTFGDGANGVRTGLGSNNDFCIGPISSNLANAASILLNSDGSGTFNGTVQARQDPLSPGGKGFYATAAGSSSNSNAAFLRLHSAGAIWGTTGGPYLYFGTYNRSTRWASLDANKFGIGGSLPSAPNIQLNNDGSASFVGNVSTGARNIYASDGEGTILPSSGGVATQRAASTPDTASAFKFTRGKSTGGGVGEGDLAVIYANGAATFSGTVQVGGQPWTGAQGTSLSTSGEVVSTNGASNYILTGRTSGSTAVKSYITGAGAALFSSWIDVGAQGTFRGAGGSDGNRAVEIKNQAGSIVGGIKGNGSAEFSGSVTIGGTAAANTIDEYEEGVFSPTVRGTTSTGTATYSEQTGKYIRIGNIVHIDILMSFNSFTGTGLTKFGNLPFNFNGSARPGNFNIFFSGTTGWTTLPSDVNYIYLSGNTLNHLSFGYYRNNGAAAGIPCSAAVAGIRISGSYIIW